MRLKGVRAINKCIEKFMKEWGLKAEMATDFSFAHESRTVTWSPIVSVKNDLEFSQFFESLGCKVKCDVFLYSLLHEIGHYHTLDSVSDEDYEYSFKRKNDTSITNSEYFILPVEIVATKWAVDYLNNNVEKVRAFWEELVPLLMNFYRINNIEVEGGEN